MNINQSRAQLQIHSLFRVGRNRSVRDFELNFGVATDQVKKGEVPHIGIEYVINEKAVDQSVG
jgi:hypothetical protein